MAFFFGSLSKGKVHKHSDIDIAIYLKEYDINEVEKMWNDLEDLLKKDIDLIVLNI
jgi:predicted nucleotidyltransferase